jgi:hypothetical protein
MSLCLQFEIQPSSPIPRIEAKLGGAIRANKDVAYWLLFEERLNTAPFVTHL